MLLSRARFSFYPRMLNSLSHAVAGFGSAKDQRITLLLLRAARDRAAMSLDTSFLPSFLFHCCSAAIPAGR